MYVCVWFNKSKTAQPIELKFCDMLPIVPSQVLGKKSRSGIQFFMKIRNNLRSINEFINKDLIQSDFKSV